MKLKTTNRNITPMSVNFAKWYTDVIKQAELCDYGFENGSAAGTIIFRPRGYAIWEHMQFFLNQQFKTLKIENVMLPLLISKKAFQREKDHIEGFAPECAFVNVLGTTKLDDPLIIRPTSEVLFCLHFAKIINSYKQLPLLYNQWCNVVRAEKTTRPFLRTSEFLWQEGHTIHSSEEEARAFTLQMIKVYATFVEQKLGIKVIVGAKTVHERFAGAKETFTIETMMQDGQALQAGTSHYFGQEFARAFDITFSTKDNKKEFGYQTSWGCSTRLIGALIMAHSDDLGLVLPPAIAPQQVAILNLEPDNTTAKNIVANIYKYLTPHFRTIINDFANKNVSYKISDSQIKGIPISIVIGQKELASNEIELLLRYDLVADLQVKNIINFNDVKTVITTIDKLLQTMQKQLLLCSQEKLTKSLLEITTFTEYQKAIKNHKGFFIVPFCNRLECEQEIKKLTSTTSRCIPLEPYHKPKNECFKCQTSNSVWTYFARAY